MKKRKALPKTAGSILALTGVLLFAVGIAAGVLTMVSARRAIYAEHDSHLADLAHTVDHNVSVVLESCREELADMVRSHFRPDGYTGENTEDPESLRAALNGSVLITSGNAVRVLVCKGQSILFASDGTDPAGCSFRGEPGTLRICYDAEEDRNYLALSETVPDTSLTCCALIDLERFYRRVVAGSVYEDYWIVLYDAGSGLSLQNDYTQPEYKLFTREEILSRNDGYSMMQRYHEAGISGAESYTFKDKQGKTHGNRMTVIPGALTENRSFGVGVAVYDNAIVKPAESMGIPIVISAFLIAFGAAMFIFLLMHNGRREAELAAENETLEKQNELNGLLLRQQEELAHHQKLETIGTLTAGVAHEFNNLLSPIMGNSLLILEESGPDSEEIYDNALEIYQVSLRAKELVSRISRLSRKGPSAHAEAISPAMLADNVLRVVQPSVPKNITLCSEIRTDVSFPGDEPQLEHMLINLLINAVHATEPDEGRITLEVTEEAGSVVFRVSDTGRGIPEKDLERIFEPFYTTRESGKGTGLGLAIVQNVVSGHGGTVRAENLPEGGARFTVMLPANGDPSGTEISE